MGWVRFGIVTRDKDLLDEMLLHEIAHGGVGVNQWDEVRKARVYDVC